MWEGPLGSCPHANSVRRVFFFTCKQCASCVSVYMQAMCIVCFCLHAQCASCVFFYMQTVCVVCFCLHANSVHRVFCLHANSVRRVYLNLQAELEALQPQLLASSAETAELMCVIEKQTEEADKVKKVVQVRTGGGVYSFWLSCVFWDQLAGRLKKGVELVSLKDHSMGYSFLRVFLNTYTHAHTHTHTHTGIYTRIYAHTGG